MPYTKINQAASGLDMLAKTVAIPREHRPLRVPSFPALERTGVLSFTDTTTFSLPAVTKGYAMMCRHAAYPCWLYNLPPSGGNAFSFYTMVNDSATPISTTANGYVVIPCPTIGNVYTSTNNYFSNYMMPLIEYSGKRFFYNVTTYMAIQLTFDIAPTTPTVVYELSYLDGTMTVVNDTRRVAVTMSGLEGSVQLTLPADVTAFRLDSISVFTTNSVAVVNVGYGITTSSSVTSNVLSSPTGSSRAVLFPLAGPTEAITTTLPWKAVRCTAAAGLFSNVTAVQYKEGTVNAARINTETASVLDFSSYEASLGRVYPKDRYFGALELGLYTFTLPDNGSDIFSDVVLGSNTQFTPTWATGGYSLAVAGIFNLDNIPYANIMVFTDIQESASTFAITIDRHIEFRSSSVLFPLGFSSLALENYHAAQMALVQMGVFFENFTHLITLARMVATAVRAVAPYVVPVVKKIGKAALSAAADKGLRMANKRMGEMKQKQMIEKSNKKQQKALEKKRRK